MLGQIAITKDNFRAVADAMASALDTQHPAVVLRFFGSVTSHSLTLSEYEHTPLSRHSIELLVVLTGENTVKVIDLAPHRSMDNVFRNLEGWASISVKGALRSEIIVATGIDAEV